MITLLFSWLLAAGISVASPPRALVAGPAIAGSRVVWGEQVGGLSVLRSSLDEEPLWQSASRWFAGPLAASPALIAFSQSFDGCPGQPGVACPVETQVVAGPARGSLRALGPAERCTTGGAHRRLAVSGVRVALLQLDCDASSATVTIRSGGKTVFTQHEAACCDVSFAGSFVAFKGGDAVDVVDLRTRRLAYRAGAPRGKSIAAFDVQSDGKLALVLGPAQDGRFAVAWRAPGVSILQLAKLRAVLPPSGPAVRLVADRLIAEQRVGSSTELIVADLHGRTRVLARFVAPIEQVGGFDAGELRVTWASRRITSTRVDCPPPGQGRPCRRLKSGVETVWASRASGAPSPVARWSFADSP